MASWGVLPDKVFEHAHFHHGPKLAIIKLAVVRAGIVPSKVLVATDAEQILSSAVKVLARLFVVEEPDSFDFDRLDLVRFSLVRCQCHDYLLATPLQQL